MEGYYEVPAMAQRIGVKEFTVRLWCRTGKLPAVWYKPGGRYGKWLVKANEFEKIMDSIITIGSVI